LGVGVPVPSSTDLELTAVQSPASATVSNVVIYTIGLTNYGPAAATSVVLTDLLPPSGMAYVSNNFANNLLGTMTSSNGVLTFSAANPLAVGAGLSFNIALMPETNISVTNTFAALDTQFQGSTNNITNLVTTVGEPNADVGVAVNASPNPVLAGNSVAITLVVTNNGPSIAYGTTVTNYLPAGLNLTSSSPSQGTVTNSAGMNIWSIGALPPNTSATNTLTAAVTVAGGTPLLDSAIVASTVYDPFKLNNFASFKIVTTAPALSILSGPRANTLFWDGAATNYVLLSTTNLALPLANWVKATNAVSSNVNGQLFITLPATTDGPRFYILTTP
jgi:uncharacterized repeat protein (TIGR01451 family)